MEQKLHTPEGVRDIYHTECKRKLAVSGKLQKILHLYGYQDIQTPTFEYFDVFRKEVGTISTRELYKFFYREGNTLALRPDFTPSIARAAATLFEDEDFPIRLCYVGNTFINHSSYKGHLKENTQLGAELIGEDSAEADAEMIAMVIDGLRSAGLQEFQINIGHVDFIRSLMETTGFSGEIIAEIHTLITNRNYFGVEEILLSEKVSEDIQQAFRLLPELLGGEEILKTARNAAPNEQALQAVARLEQIYGILKLYGVEECVTFDLSMSGSYGYYSGIIFRAYTYGTGDAVVRGGRYDHLLEKFGRQTPSIGFAVLIDDLLNAMNRQKIDIATGSASLLVYDDTTHKWALSLAKDFRQKGRNIALLKRNEMDTKQHFIEYARRTQIPYIVYIEDVTHISTIQVSDGEEKMWDFRIGGRL